MIVPPKIKLGSLVALIAPSAAIERKHLYNAYKYLKDLNLNILEGTYLFERNGYFAGDDEKRLDDLQFMINHKEIEAIFCVRGGYGLSRIVDRLDVSQLYKYPKWIVGFSDTTSLHLKLNKSGLMSAHALMPVQFGNDKFKTSLESLSKLLFCGRFLYYSKPSINDRYGRVKSELIGGNLSLIVDSIGTQTEINTQNKILFVEEVCENHYKIDRMFNHLYRADKLLNISGMVVGTFSSLKDESSSFGQTTREIIQHYIKDLSIPICFDFPIGHTSNNLAIFCGSQVELSVTRSGTYLSSSF